MKLVLARNQSGTGISFDSSFLVGTATSRCCSCRSVLFCQLVDDPSGYVEELIKDKGRAKATEEELLMEPEGEKDLSPRLRERLVEKERERLHNLVKELVIWENTTNDNFLNRARREIKKTWQRQCRRDGKPEDTPMPPVLDPFAGGGAIPLEAQRLGMEAHASDLNPVALLSDDEFVEIAFVSLARNDGLVGFAPGDQRGDVSHDVVRFGLGGLVASLAFSLENRADVFVVTDRFRKTSRVLSVKECRQEKTGRQEAFHRATSRSFRGDSDSSEGRDLPVLKQSRLHG